MSIYIDQRMQPREKHQQMVMISRRQEDDWSTTTMRDCSMDGISFIAKNPYLPQTHLYIKLGKNDEAIPVEVKWSKPLHEISRKGEYEVGVNFSDMVEM